ncbi:MAG TPA: hypothetical protein ENI60_03645 [Candidatus Fraserbacteria bacterium]|nr:hypothetical protein [Candidatus Fraserbacteria bacterium]
MSHDEVMAMILYVSGNIFQAPAQVLVNTVNTVGVMGKGVAYDFKRLFPEMFKQYRQLCEQGKLKIGTLWLYKSANKWVLNFPTKQHWRNPSRLEYIGTGLGKFVATYTKLGIQSIAFPPLGCGNGGLDFQKDVQPLMHEYLSRLPIDVFVYPDLKDAFVPEHEDPLVMKAWLRSEPTSLPFSEVWEDIEQLLGRRHSFETIANHHPFIATVKHAPRAIEIVASNKRYYVPYDSLMAFWQQLRTHGFSTRNIVPSLSRQVYYLAPLFASLSYVKPVKVAVHYADLRRSPIIGLQVLPLAFNRGRQQTQLPLFKSALPTTYGQAQVGYSANP